MVYQRFLQYFLLLLITTPFFCPAQAQGKFIIIDGHKIWVNMQGEKTHQSVIFVSGAGEDDLTWGGVQPAISKTDFTLSYDRIGLGKSDSLPRYHKDASSMAAELFVIITVLKIHGPLVIVGHSIGCQIARIFAGAHPSLVKGILFIDPGFSELGLKSTMPETLWKKRVQAIKEYLPADVSKAQLEELREISNSCAEAERAKVSKDAKVILLTATKVTPGFPGADYEAKFKRRSHQRWQTEMPQTLHEFVSQSRHYIQNDVPGLIIEKIKQLVL